MTQVLLDTFATCKKNKKPVFVSFLTSGFPSLEETVPLLLALEAGGSDVIELGIPHSDPLADGPTIQESSNVALEAGVTLQMSLDFIKEARAAGLKVPVVLMGYYNPFYSFGERKIVVEAREAGANGFIVVDLPPDQSEEFRGICREEGMSYIPLVAPTTSDERLAYINQVADSFVYCISLLGVTGQRTDVSLEVESFATRIRENIDHPIIFGFGISKKEHVEYFSQYAEGVVVGSHLIKTIRDAPAEARVEDTKKAVQCLCQGVVSKLDDSVYEFKDNAAEVEESELPNHFGDFGGTYAPETLMGALSELEAAYIKFKDDPGFQEELRSYYSYVGRPTPVYFCERLTKVCGGAEIWLKREDLAHTGAHKINNAIGQALLAKRLGKTRIIAETGAGQHGVACATICAKMGLECIVYMGSEDIQRQSLNVFKMKLLGTKVVPVESGSKTLKDAINEAMRDWVTNIRTTHYMVGSAIGPHPFPTIVRDFQSVIGKEARQQMLDKTGSLPTVAIACVGGGSNAIGLFHPFIEDKEVELVGVEAAGDGVDTDKHCATLVKGTPGVLHGTRTMLLQDHDGQIQSTHSISAGLDYPGVGPEHAWLQSVSRAKYIGCDDQQALEGFKVMTETEGIIPALESSHAVWYALQIAPKMKPEEKILICMSGRGDKDLGTVSKALGVVLVDV